MQVTFFGIGPAELIVLAACCAFPVMAAVIGLAAYAILGNRPPSRREGDGPRRRDDEETGAPS
jgi:hypothetical protein